ncbi:hypothetical protein KKA24_02265, partial [Patescibacteria group bacterium]|nr:hypothetical protein [Patescibacteria group bacterium]
TVISVDPAISKKDNSSFTGIITAKVYGHGKNLKIYILPNSINKRMNSSEILETIRQMHSFLRQDSIVRIFIEDVGFQRMIAQQLNNENIPAEEIKIQGDKEMRLWSISNLIREGKIVFPEKGTEKLINQVINLGIEKHNDLVDALTLLGLEVVKDKTGTQRVTVFTLDD